MRSGTFGDSSLLICAGGSGVARTACLQRRGLRLYGIGGTSICVPGDADELRGESPAG